MKSIKTHPKTSITNGVQLTLIELLKVLSDFEININERESFFIDNDTQVSIRVNGKKVTANEIDIELWDSSDEFLTTAQLMGEAA